MHLQSRNLKLRANYEACNGGLGVLKDQDNPIKEIIETHYKNEFLDKVNSLNDQQLKELSEYINTLSEERATLDVGKVFKDPEDSYFIDCHLCTGIVDGKRVGIGFFLDRKVPNGISFSKESEIPKNYVKVDHLDPIVIGLVKSTILPFADFITKWTLD